jgi:hypothetical protein
MSTRYGEYRRRLSLVEESLGPDPKGPKYRAGFRWNLITSVGADRAFLLLPGR